MSFNIGDLLIATGPRNCRSLTKTELMTLLGNQFINKFKANDDAPVSNSIVLADDSDLFFNVGANEIWQWEMGVAFQDNAGSNFVFDFTGPTSPTLVKYGITERDAGGFNALFLATGFNQVITAFGNVSDNNSRAFNSVRGLIINAGNPGIIQFRYTQRATSAQTLQLLSGSYLIAHKIG